MPKQRFEDLPGLGTPPYRKAVNVCLFLGNDKDNKLHLPNPPGQARMAGVDWGRGYARIMARLSDTSPGSPKPLVFKPRTIEEPPLERCPFVFCPNLARSFLPLDMARHFNLTTRRVVSHVCRVPLTRSLTGTMTPATSNLLARAYMTIDCNSAVDPPPFPKSERVTFLVLDQPWAQKRVGILGRDVIRHMLLLYCGSDPTDTITSTGDRPRLCFGRVKGN